MTAQPGGGFFARRWRGDVPTATLLWRDMLGVGSAVNMVATFAGLMLVARDAPLAWAAALHFAPLPYNVFLFAAVARSRQRQRLTMVLASAWLAVVTLI